MTNLNHKKMRNIIPVHRKLTSTYSGCW